MRQGGRDHVQFNEAGDFAINGLILDAGFTLPEGGMVDPAFHGMAAEEIYARRYRKPTGGGGDDGDQRGPGGSQSDNIGGCGSFKQASEDTAADARQLAAEWQSAVVQAAAIADRAGSLPGNVKEFIEAMLQSRVDWIEALKRFVSEPARQDYTWSPPNRRYVGSGLYLPSLRSEGIGTVVFAIDTSISMNSDVLQQALAELNTILSDVQPEKVVVIECDTAVHHVATFTPEQFPIRAATLHGRGGTAFSPVFEKVAELNLEPACLIYYTDLECMMFGPEPNYPVLWAATQRGSAPFGEVLLVNA
jgi:predicted metal-dependent peptidase